MLNFFAYHSILLCSRSCLSFFPFVQLALPMIAHEHVIMIILNHNRGAEGSSVDSSHVLVTDGTASTHTTICTPERTMWYRNHTLTTPPQVKQMLNANATKICAS